MRPAWLALFEKEAYSPCGKAFFADRLAHGVIQGSGAVQIKKCHQSLRRPPQAATTLCQPLQPRLYTWHGANKPIHRAMLAGLPFLFLERSKMTVILDALPFAPVTHVVSDNIIPFEDPHLGIRC